MSYLNENKMADAEAIVNTFKQQETIKVVKRDRGLIERNTNGDTKIILAEDNRQVLLG